MYVCMYVCMYKGDDKDAAGRYTAFAGGKLQRMGQRDGF